MKPIRILHVVDSLSQASGMMSVIMNYYRHIDRDEIQFDILYFNETPVNYYDEINRLGGKAYYLKRPSLSSCADYNNFFKEHADKYIAVHLHLAFLNWFILPLAKKNGIKYLITHSHTTSFSDKKLNALRNRLFCLPIKLNANQYFACSKAAAEFLYGKRYVKSGKVMIINNAIEVERYKYNPFVREKVREELNLTDRFIVGHVGRFVNQKNHVFLLQIFAEIKKRKPNSVLLLIGDGPLFEYIKNKAKLLNIEDSVVFLGRKSNVADYLQAMDVFVLPSLYEGLPVIGIEAQTAGLTCYFSDVITKETAITNVFFLSLKDSPVIWAEKILETSISSRTDMTSKLKEFGFDITQEAKKLGDFYLNLGVVHHA